MASLSQPALAAELERRRTLDQQVRSESPADPDRVDAIDADNRDWLRSLITEYGWPLASMVGERGANTAWLLAQHADRDITLQRVCLTLLREACRIDEASPADLAYLEDRVRVNSGGQQLYGTQGRPGADGVWQPLPVEDADGMDARRRLAGLDPFETYQRNIQAFLAERTGPGQPPQRPA